ncbi:hypothetical protein D0864_11539 [Hortaea werneckii]|uniref:Uncharacterized protein n=1 Tax=Hortaea werneckii TaxID=91943 RepID=A0A3M7DTD3_HORWE|nr:hypothetical protein D0864_11539 [Hortaea werneckii]
MDADHYKSLAELVHCNEFAFYHRSVRKDDVVVITADKIPRLPLSGINPQQEQNLWVALREGLSEDEYKDVAAQVETRMAEAVAAVYARRRAHDPQQQVSPDPASESSAASTAPPTPPAGQQQEQRSEKADPALYITLIYKPPHPYFPGIPPIANIDIRLYSDEDMLPVLDELRDADARITSVFEAPEIIDS